jgi:hypothetical protein
MLGQSLFAGTQEDMHAYSYFCVHPLIAIEHFINERNELNIPNYPRHELFSTAHFLYDSEPAEDIPKIKDVDIPNYEDLRDKVNEVIEWFRTEYTLQKLSGAETSEWQDKVLLALKHMDSKKLFKQDLRAICKLVPFFDFNQEVLNLADKCDSAKNASTQRLTFKGLHLLNILQPQHQQKRGQKAHFFRTSTNHLLRVDFDSLTSSAVHTILDLNQTINLDITVNPRIIYTNNFTYFTTYKIHSIGA